MTAPAIDPVVRRIDVRAGRAHCFDVFVRMGAWWPRTHKIGAAALVDAVLEPRVGGRWYERGEDGSECEWGRVLSWEPPERLVLDWQIGADFRHDPAVHTTVEVTFVAIEPGLTRVELVHRDLEGFGPNALAGVAAISSEMGWSGILAIWAGVAAA